MLSLSAIIFIHEMGHLVAALLVKMKVNTFSIGFGPAIKSWKWRGIDWKLSWLPLGGYVSIHGLDDGQESGPGSYYSVPVYKRLFVIALGPITNIVLAWMIFLGIHQAGGLAKPYSEVTSVAGWVDPSSELAKFVKPGDIIYGYDGKKLSSSKDHLYYPLLASGSMSVEFESIDYARAKHAPQSVKVIPYSHPEAADPSFKTAGIFSGARWLVIDSFSDKVQGFEKALASSGAQVGDLIVALNGQRLFSERQLNAELNSPFVWVGVQRGDAVFNTKLPLVMLADISISKIQLEWRDWLFALDTKEPLLGRKCLPLNLNVEGVIEEVLSKDVEVRAGDKLLSINGEAFHGSKELCALLQNPPATIVLYRGLSPNETSFEVAQDKMQAIFSEADLEALLQLPFVNKIEQKGAFIRLAPVKTIPFEMIAADYVKQYRQSAQLIVEESARARMLKLIDDKSKEHVLGVRLVDLTVLFNPSAQSMMGAAVKQIGSALNALLTGQLSMKWMAGPVGMVTIVTQGFAVGLKQAFYWLAIISLNLGLFNLLPLPMLDGGRLVIEVIEALTGRRLPSVVMEFVTYALFIALIGFGLVATYWDIWRLATLWKS